MRKFILFFVPLLFWGCDKTFENVIDVNRENYQVTSVSGIKDTIDLKIPSDSLLNLRLIFASGSVVNRAYFNIIDPDGNSLPAPVELNKFSEVLYENQFTLRPTYTNGSYNVQFSVTGFDEINRLVAVRSFYFNNGQDNIPPVISNTVIDPDTVVVDSTVVIFTSVEASDSNGYNDIDEVYFVVYKPDGTSNFSKILMYDDGNITEHGDLAAGDGIFSRLIQIDETNDKGTYRFEFLAEDRVGNFSNILNHFVLIL